MPFLPSFLTGTIFFFISRYFFHFSILLFSASVILLVRKGKSRSVIFIIIGIMYAFFSAPHSEQPLLPWNKKLEVSGRFLPKMPAPASISGMQEFVVERAVDAETGFEFEALEGEKMRLYSDAEFDPDDTYELLVQTGRDRTRLNPGSVGRAALSARLIGIEDQEEGGIVPGNFLEKERALLHQYIMARFSRESADFLSAVTVGKVHFDDDLRKAFSSTGLAHILSISGTHFGLLSVIMFGCLLFLINRLPYHAFQRLTIYLSPRQAAAIACFPFMLLYLGISGGSIPAVRAFVMISLFLVGLLMGRKGFWFNTVLLAAFLLVLWEPEVILKLSFQLSFIAVLFIGASIKRKEDDDDNNESSGQKKGSAPAEFVGNSLRLTLAATIGTAPLVAYHFHYFSLISPLSNLIVAPLIGFIVLPLALISSFAYILTGHYLFGPLVGHVTDLSLWLVRLMARIPFADVGLPALPPALIVFFYCGFLLYFAWGRKKRALLISVLPFLVYTGISLSSPKALSVTFLDVGQGDAAVAELPDGKVLVVDTGRTGYETANFLRYTGRREVDALVISHCHPDHAGGMSHILRRFSVKEIWDNGRIEYPRELALRVKPRGLGRGDVAEGGSYRIEALHPYPEFYSMEGNDFVEENNSSLVIKIKGRQHSFLFVGDVEEEAEEDMSRLGIWLRSDVLKAPHHGGISSVHEGFLFEVSPSIAVISAGRDNSFGHPRPEMLEALAGARIFRTDQDGAVKVTETDKGLMVRTYHDYAMKRSDSLSEEMRNLRRLFSVW